jgi:hypothetical protein
LKITHHAVVGAVAALPLMKWSLPGAIGFWTTSILPDLDHFIFYCLHEKRIYFSLRKFLSAYKKWNYFGPRIHIFHNYEILLLGLIIAWLMDGLAVYLYGGLLFHLICDQVDTYRLFRYLRVKSLIGDLLRYRKYVRACEAGREQEFMIFRRDSWWNHLRCKLAPDRLEAAKRKCEILNIYPEQPIDAACDGGMWQKIF